MKHPLSYYVFQATFSLLEKDEKAGSLPSNPCICWVLRFVVIIPYGHTFATHALASGVDAKTLSGILGHTNASFTLDTYTHVTPDMQKTASGIVGGFMEDLFGKELKPWQESEKAETEP